MHLAIIGITIISLLSFIAVQSDKEEKADLKQREIDYKKIDLEISKLIEESEDLEFQPVE